MSAIINDAVMGIQVRVPNTCSVLAQVSERNIFRSRILDCRIYTFLTDIAKLLSKYVFETLHFHQFLMLPDFLFFFLLILWA